jgi:mono/diheme cytochrome c family protein
VIRLAVVAVVVGLASVAPAVDGRALYGERCSACHGATGAGDGPAAAAFDPRPRNFRDEAFWRGRTAADLGKVVREGKPGTLMPPFTGTLSDAEIDAVVGYLESFRPAAH